MRYFILALLLFTLINTAGAQTKIPVKTDTNKIKTAPNERTEKFKKSDSAYKQLSVKTITVNADSADLKLKTCEFEKDANAEVLFDIGQVAFGDAGIMMMRFKRIKIFNDNGKGEANIRIEYSNKFGAEHILAVVAETLNLNNGKIEHTKLDSGLIYNVHTDKQKDAVVFTMPNVKAGSVIQYGYVWLRNASRNCPDWDFQCRLPTRFSQFNLVLNPRLSFTQLTYTNQPFATDTVAMRGYGHVWAMKNIISAKNEPFMRSSVDGLQRISLILRSVTDFYGQTQNLSDSWATIGKQIAGYKEFSKPYDQNISDAGDLLTKAKAFKTNDEKIEFLFNQVKAQMAWNGEENWVSKDGIRSAWKKKTGNWGEINMILCNLLKKAGIKAYPMMVSTRDNGIMYANFFNIFQINKLVTYVPVDSTTYYVLDATGKYNIYNQIPFNLLNSSGLYLDKEKEDYKLIYLHNEVPVRQVISISAEIKPDGTMSGTTQISSVNYDKANYLESYKTLDEKKYQEFLTDDNNSLRITSLKIENADVDSLPLTQDIDFKLDLPGADDKYIYFNPNIFTHMHNNPFISPNRASDIDFGYKGILSITGIYKIPAGYKVDALPQSIALVTSDKSIIFKRSLALDGDSISVYYQINYKRSIYKKEEYSGLYIYFKKMYELLSEQIALKKI